MTGYPAPVFNRVQKSFSSLKHFPIMIAYLKGTFTEITPTSMIVECAGVGYEVNISLNTYTALQSEKEGRVLTTEVIREDAHLLYGFATHAEQILFVKLTSVSGVGPNTARVILSSYAPNELTQIIETGQTDALKAVKGIGLKTAQRILVDLKGKLTLTEEMAPSGSGTGINMPDAHAAEEAISALKMLGFADAPVRKAVKTILMREPSAPVEDIIKQALRML